MARQRKLTKPSEVALVVVYGVQALGEASPDEVYDALHEKDGRIRKLNVKIGKADIRAQLEALRAKGLASIRYGTRADEESKVQLYKLKRQAWSATPEIATFTAMHSQLIKTVEGDEMKAFLDLNENSEDPKEVKGAGTSRNHYRGFKTLHLVGRLLTPWYGSQPIVGNPALEALWKESPDRPEGTRTTPKVSTKKKQGKEEKVYDYGVELVFERAADGRLFIHGGVVCGWLGLACHRYGFSDLGLRAQVGSPGIFIKPEKKLLVEQRPVNNRGEGQGMTRFEVLQAGQTFAMVFHVPTEGPKAPPLDLWRNILATASQFAPRHMSPARGKMSGAFELLSLSQVREAVPIPDWGSPVSAADIQHLTGVAAPS